MATPGPLPTELLRFDHVALGYGRRQILSGLNFTLMSGDYVAVVGSNGSGKSTFLKSVVGTLRPQSGRLVVAPRLHLGYVPQLQTVDEIYPLTVAEVVLMGRYGRIGAMHRPGPTDRDKAERALLEVGIADLGPRLYRELSGGQKQRTLIARALANEPDVLVLDEHTNDLDIAAEKAIMALIDRVHAEHNIAVVMVSHSLNTVANHAKKIGIIDRGSLELGPVDQVMRADYLQQIYGIPLRVLEVEGAKVVV